MKMDRYFRKLAACCWLLLALCACENNHWDGEETRYNVVLGKLGEVGEPTSLASLTYHFFLFRAKVTEGSELKEYRCWKIETRETEEEAKKYSFKISNQEIGIYDYQLFVHATPTVPETEVIGISDGSPVNDIEVGMVKVAESDGYVPLSKDNYYAFADLSAQEMEEGKMIFKLSLKRLVGQLVFDFFKSSLDGTPQNIDSTYLSTLDRVFNASVQVQGMTSKIKLAGGVATKEESNKISHQFNTTLETDYRLDVLKQNPVNIAGVEKDEIAIKGGARVFSVYLLPTGADENNILKAELTFSYYDTPLLSGMSTPAPKKLLLRLPSTKDGVLKVKENCYTLTNVRLINNRIIDLNASGEVEINTDWD